MRARHSLLNRFRHDAGGTVALILGLSLVMLCVTVGLAIDASRAYNLSNKIEAILDAAALAGAKLLDDGVSSDSQIRTKTQAFVNAHLPGLDTPGVTIGNILVTSNRTDSSVNVSADITMPTTFGQIAGVTTFSFNRDTTVIYRMKKVELAMALDITGSMADIPPGDTLPKVESLKIAAKSVVDTIFADATNDTNVRIALAPFSASINPGGYAWAVTGGSASSGCVVERPGSDNADDAAPLGSDRLTPFAGPGVCPLPSISPLSGRSQSAAIKSVINQFTPGGSTAGHLGMAWAWYMLSPSWANVFTGSAAPNPYSSSGDVIKVAVIMTDGLFNTSYLTGPSPNTAQAVDESYAQFNALCTNMKARGIRVYTVGLGLNDARATSELQGCASDTASFFAASTGAELTAAFQSIVDRLNTLRVAQ